MIKEQLREKYYADRMIIKKAAEGKILTVSCFNVTKDTMIRQNGSDYVDRLPPMPPCSEEMKTKIFEDEPEAKKQSPTTQYVLLAASSQLPDPEERKRFVRMCSHVGLLKAFEEGRTEQTMKYTRIISGVSTYVSTRLVLTSNPENDNVYAFFYTSDITEITKEKQERNEQLSEALKAAEQLSMAKNEFLSGITQDMCTPMTTILECADVLMDNAENPDRVRAETKKILTNGNTLLEMLNDVLDMSRIGSGNMQLNPGLLQLSETISQVEDMMRPKYQEKQQSFEVSFQGVSNEEFVADEERIKKILINVLSNAWKYTEEGGHIEMKVRNLPTDSNLFENVSFEISDDGRGMSEEYQKELFDPFTREKQTGYTQTQGTGLGMAITKNLVNLFGGTISVKSSPGKGSTFTIVLPLKLA